MRTILRLIVGACLLVGLGTVAFYPLGYIKAESAYRRSASSTGLDKVNLLKQALEYSPHERRYLRDLAAEQLELSRPAMSYRALVELVTAYPSWPYAWDQLLNWHVRQRSFDDVFMQVLERSRALGEQSDFLAWNRVAASVSALSAFGKNEQPPGRLLQEVREGMDINRDKVLAYAVLTEQVQPVCRHAVISLEEQEGIKRWCANSRRFIHNCLKNGPLPGMTATCRRVERYWWSRLVQEYRLPWTYDQIRRVQS